MALPSQSGRPMNSQRFMYSRRGWKMRLIVAVVLLAVTVLAVWWLWPEPVEETERSTAASQTNLQRENSQDNTAAEEVESPDSFLADDASNKPEPSARRSLTMGGANKAGSQDQTSSSSPNSKAEQSPSPTTGDHSARDDQPLVDGFGEVVANEVSQQDRQRAQQRLQRGLSLQKANNPVNARQVLTDALASEALTESDAAKAREMLTAINDRLIFSPEIVEDDPFVHSYTVEQGDLLSTIAAKQNLKVDWRFIQRINRIRDVRRIRPGQRLKLFDGAFHAVISKRGYRLDLFLGDSSQRVFVKSYPVGLGEYGSTPLGHFVVREDSRSLDPEWTNPRTGEHFRANDPDNPIGDHWIGLRGVGENNKDILGYGIHGTIAPKSIGKQMSMGCIRMKPQDVEVVFEVLTEDHSTIVIQQ